MLKNYIKKSIETFKIDVASKNNILHEICKIIIINSYVGAQTKRRCVN
jgi:hypothetical protein